MGPDLPDLPDRGAVSVVIPTKNSSRTLAACLASVRAQSYPYVEVIVVDDRSPDGSAGIARSAGVRLIEQASNTSEARNIGLAAARGEYLLALDADMTLSPTVVERCVAIVGQGSDAVVLPELAVGDGFWGEALAFNRNLSLPDQRRGVDGLPRFFRRERLLALGGWDPGLYVGEDRDLLIRWRAAGGRVVTVPDLVYHSEGAPGLREIYAKWARYYASAARFERKHPDGLRVDLVRDILRRYASAYGTRQVARHPGLALGGGLVRAVRWIAMVDGRRG
jgi:glycosyltransferase involved in cell wall biosynthesis